MDTTQFQELIWNYYHQHGRDLPWRRTTDPYKILVSEIMLQQTQGPRVVPKYEQFLNQFPNAKALANTSLASVITAWSGLGYNRRAKYLHEAAKQLKDKKTWTLDDLTACKGIGVNTAAAVLTYAYNQVIPFIETNVRTVYIHHFFEDHDEVSDKQLLPFVTETLDQEHPREWFWALMDYGSYLKTQTVNPSRRSKHYTKQSKFEGSRRQLRGQILRELATQKQTRQQLINGIKDDRLTGVLDDLVKEGLITKNQDIYGL